MHLDWFTFVSHDPTLLPLQMEYFDKYGIDEIRVWVLQGPYGNNPLTSAGDWRITKPAARKLGLTNLIEVPDLFAGMLMPWRYRYMVEWLWEKIIKPDEDIHHALITHSDLFPMADFSFESLLVDNPIAGTAFKDREDANASVTLTWLAVDVDHCRHAKLNLGNDRPSLGGFDITMHGLKQMTKADVAISAPEIADDYRDDMRCEWVEPCFFHLSKQACLQVNKDFDALHETKCDLLGKRPVTLEKLCYKTGGVYHPSRHNATNLFCKWRSNEHIRTVKCPGCVGNVALKVFSCSEYGECVLDSDVGIRTCGGAMPCKKYQEVN